MWVPAHEIKSLDGFHLFSKMGASLLKRGEENETESLKKHRVENG